MEIMPKNKADAIESYANQVQVKPKTEELTEKDPPKPAVNSDTVVISETAKRIRAAQSQLDAIPDVRSDKVAEIRRRIEDGTYEIKPDQIAEKMIRESLLNDLYK